NRFDVVPVRTDDESGKVVCVVLRTQTRRTIVFTAGRQSRAVESLNLPPILGRKRQMKRRGLLAGLVQAQRSRTFSNKLDAVARRPLRTNGHSERRERLTKERLARRIVADSKFDVVKHAFSWSL